MGVCKMSECQVALISSCCQGMNRLFSERQEMVWATSLTAAKSYHLELHVDSHLTFTPTGLVLTLAGH